MQAAGKQIKAMSRLKNRADFLRVQNGGVRWVSKGLVLQAAENGGAGVRFGLTVSKKLEASAVGRNRIRRRLRAAAFEVLPVHAKNADYVLIGRGGSAARPYGDLCGDLKWCLEKTGYLR